jgi:hypothetical protein
VLDLVGHADQPTGTLHDLGMYSATLRGSRPAQSVSEMPIVTARTSRFSDLIMLTVSRISCSVMKTTGRLLEGAGAARCGA